MSHWGIPPFVQSLGGTGLTNGAGAGSVTYTPKTADFTTAANINYLCTNGAGQGIFLTLNASPVDGERFWVVRRGAGAVLINACTINGYACRMAALSIGPHTFEYDAGNSTWWTAEEHIGMIVSTGTYPVTQFITAQKGYTTVVGAHNNTWADQSGNAYDFTTNASAVDPTWSATSGGGNNHPAVTGVADAYMDSPDGAQWNIDACTFICGLKPADRSAANILNHFSTNVGWSFTHSETTTGMCNAKFQASAVADTSNNRLGEDFSIVSIVHTTSIVNEIRFHLNEGLSIVVTCTGTAGDLSAPLRLWATQAGATIFNGAYLGHAIWPSVLPGMLRNYGERFFKFAGRL